MKTLEVQIVAPLGAVKSYVVRSFEVDDFSDLENLSREIVAELKKALEENQ
jgi:hypothetical protein